MQEMQSDEKKERKRKSTSCLQSCLTAFKSVLAREEWERERTFLHGNPLNSRWNMKTGEFEPRERRPKR